MLLQHLVATRRPRLLLTGFKPWGDHPLSSFNPSQAVLPNLATRARHQGYQVKVAIMSVDTGVIRSMLEDAYHDFVPDFALHLGLHGFNNKLNIEAAAYNGVSGIFDDRLIPKNAPEALDSSLALGEERRPSLDVVDLVTRLNAAGRWQKFVTAETSRMLNDRFGCNMCHFLALGLAEEVGAVALFIHLPQDSALRYRFPKPWKDRRENENRIQDMGKSIGMPLIDMTIQLQRLTKWWIKQRWPQRQATRP